MNDLTTILEGMLDWSESKLVHTARGKRNVRSAEANGQFWGLWRTCKPAMQEVGISPKREQDGTWTISWFTAVAGEESQPAKSTGIIVSDKGASEQLQPVVKPIVASNTTERVWSDEQKAIFEWFRSSKLPDGTSHRALVVRARAGTGKTTTIKAAFAEAPEERCLYAVFNKKNQREASEAITDPRVEIKTLHSVGFMFIQQVWPGCRPTDEVENDRVEKIVGEQSPREVKTQVKKLVGFAKNTFANIPSIEELTELAEERDIECPQFEEPESGGFTPDVLASLAQKVMKLSTKKDAKGQISFNDMVWLPVAMGWTRAWYDLVVVDECQDMNLPQLLMAKAACKPTGRICVVGDDRQAIYHFRGAASDGMDMMKTSLQAAELGLTTTYRCPKRVVAIASTIVPDYKAADAAPEGIVEESTTLNIISKLEVGNAVLSRANAPLMPLCLGLLRAGKPARIEGRDIGKALREIVEKLNACSVPQFIDKVDSWRYKQQHRFANSKSYEEKCQQIDDQADTLIAIAEGTSSVTEIKVRLDSLFQDSGADSKPAIVLSTVHKAKGLEWPKVILLRDTFNRKRPQSAPPLSPVAESARIREESNIYYVALTRAKTHLVLASGK